MARLFVFVHLIALFQLQIFCGAAFDVLSDTPVDVTIDSAAKSMRSLLQVGNNLRKGQILDDLWIGRGLSLSMLQRSSQVKTHSVSISKGESESAGKSKGSQSRDPRDPDFFDAFDQDESTYDKLEDPGPMRTEGWDPVDAEKVPEGASANAAWFHESESMGPKQALQTHFPALPTGDARYIARPGWHMDNAGTWVQSREPASRPGSGGTDGVKNPEWFERSIDQIDIYGRPKTPPGGVQTGQYPTTTRVVTGNITCEKPGCSSHTLLHIYNPSKEFVRDCEFGMKVHATDYDDNYSGERVRNLLANGKVLGKDCFPAVNGCVAGLDREQLYSCNAGIPVNSIISSEGKLKVEAGIPDVVDECPYRGNLLHAVATVTCQVGVYTTTTTTTFTVPPAKPVMPKAPPPVKIINASAALKCAERGCITTAGFALNTTTLQLNKCTLKVWVNQTDFDNDDGAIETLSLNVSGKEAKKDLKPGRNPCRKAYAAASKSGAVLAQPKYSKKRLYLALDDYDVTEQAKQGPVLVTARISKQVDECQSQGYLLDGQADISCKVTTVGSMLVDKEVTIPEVLIMNKALKHGTVEEANAAVRTLLKKAKKNAVSLISLSTVDKTKHIANATQH
eukprot:TRINITY_DN99273_c0_g1_i1.p1 TRINITY_DN99273_c0_g1~~TRINITY_DN99273_c0_g1_i1.p1  ORF type:complete len:622 (-),score=110.49 TRINITY_DN99273_c0_g1_i1:253-2118(-)